MAAQKRATPWTGKPLPDPPAEPVKVNILDLPGDQVRRIEIEGGTRLGDAPRSVHERLCAVVAAVYGVDLDATSALTLRTLSRYVEIVDDEDDDPGND